MNPMPAVTSRTSTYSSGGKRIAMRNVVNGSIYYYAEDVLGSSRTIVQPGQTSVCYDADFYPYGGERDITVSCSPNYKFEGKERDTETNNDDFGARYYSSRFGRWLSADWSAIPAPVPYANLTNPQTLNLYAMVSDNPETFADLDGHDPPPPGTSGSGSAAGEPCVPSTSFICAATTPPAQNQTQQPQAQQQSPDLQQQAVAATAQKAQEARASQDAPPVGSPEYAGKVSGQVNAEMAAGNKIIAGAAVVEAVGVAVVAAAPAAAVTRTGLAYAAANPQEVSEFKEGVQAGASPGPATFPVTPAGIAGYVAGIIIKSIFDK